MQIPLAANKCRIICQPCSLKYGRNRQNILDSRDAIFLLYSTYRKKGVPKKNEQKRLEPAVFCC